jgi:tetratricopeptide (TPR) repeat protein/DNA-binding CsgD family transcriptional regulator
MMSLSFNRSLLCPIIVGREAHIDLIHQLAMQARAGKGAVALVAGGAGIGKSRLVAQAQARLVAEGFTVLRGNCFESDRSLPYAPFVDLFHSFILGHSPDQIPDLFGSDASEFVRLLPELASWVPNTPVATPLESAAERRRLFDAILSFFVRRAAEKPLCIIIEDLHWADDSSLEILLYLSRRLAAQSMFLIGTYRSNEVRPELGHFLSELDRERIAAEFQLAPLTREQTDTMLGAIFNLNRPVRSEFLDPIYKLTEGNPFFIEETLKSLAASGEISFAESEWDRRPIDVLHAPRSISQAVLERLAQLTESTRRVIELAAVAGRRFDFGLLLKSLELDERDLLKSLKELVTAQLVIEESSEQFAFRHELTRQAIYSSLLLRERKHDHHLIAETIERIHADSLNAHSSELALHYYHAQMWDKAFPYSKLAGERAQEVYAPREAVEHFSRAFESAQHFGSHPPLYDLSRARGIAYETCGSFDNALADYESALTLARQSGDGNAEWQSLIDLGALWASRDYAKTGDYIQQALELGRKLNDDKILARSMNRVGNWHLNVEQPREALRYHHQALEIFRKSDDREGIAETYDLLGMTSYLSGDLILGKEYYEQAIALFREMGNRQGLVSAKAPIVMCSATPQTDTMVTAEVTPGEIAGEGEAALKIAREIGWRSGEAFTLLNLAMCLVPAGEYSSALNYAQTGVEIAEDIGHREWSVGTHCAAGVAALELFDYSKACHHLERALVIARESGSLHWIRTATGFLASAYVSQNELERAEAILKDALVAAAPIQTLGGRLVACASADLALAQKLPKAALQITDELIASAPNIEDRVILRVWKLRGESLAMLNRTSEAERYYLQARDEAVKRGALPLLWRIDVALGQIHQAQRRYDLASEAFSDAWRIIEHFAAKIQDSVLRDTFVKRARAIIPQTREPSARDLSKRKYGGLTARERDVTRLIAQGKSNREIAQLLVVTERTVETHVGNILSKLGFASRTKIAAWAIENGLAGLANAPTATS